jgi:hypothetical protein
VQFDNQSQGRVYPLPYLRIICHSATKSRRKTKRPRAGFLSARGPILRPRGEIGKRTFLGNWWAIALPGSSPGVAIFSYRPYINFSTVLGRSRDWLTVHQPFTVSILYCLAYPVTIIQGACIPSKCKLINVSVQVFFAYHMESAINSPFQ